MFFLMETKNIVFFELISKKSKSFFKSLVFNRSAMYENSEFEICFFKPLILNFSSANNIKFALDLLRSFFLKLTIQTNQALNL